MAAARARFDEYFASYNRALKTGDTKAHRETFTKACSLCLSSARTIDDLTSGGQRIVGGEFTVSNVTVYDAKHLVIQAQLRQAAATVKSSSDSVVKRYPATKPSYSLFHFKAVDGVVMLDRIVA